MNLNDFSLLKEDNESYTIGHPSGKSMSIAKKGLSGKAQGLISKLRKEQKFADGGGVDLDTILDPNAPEANSESAPATPDFIAEDQPAPKMTAADEQSNQLTQDSSQTPPPPSAPPSQVQQQQTQSAASPGPDQPIMDAEAAQKGAVSAEQKAGKKQQQIYSNLANQLEDTSTPMDIIAQNKAKDAQLEQAVKDGKIDPDRFWNNKSTGSKVATSLGVLIGGLGGGPNLALENLRNSVQQDIAAQQNDQSKNMNLWKMNREALGNDQAATLQTENQYNSIAQAKLKAAASGALGPQAAANASQGILALENQRMQNNRMLGLMQWSKQPGISNQDPTQLINSLVPKEQQAKAYEELGKVQQAVQLKKDVVQSYNDLNNKLLGGSLSPNDRSSAVNAYGGILAKLSEGRFNLEESKQQMDALLPGRFEDEQTRKNKMARLNNFFDGLVQTPTLEGNFINPKKFASTNLATASQSYLPGTVVSVKGKQYKVGSDGDSLTPV